MVLQSKVSLLHTRRRTFHTCTLTKIEGFCIQTLHLLGQQQHEQSYATGRRNLTTRSSHNKYNNSKYNNRKNRKYGNNQNQKVKVTEGLILSQHQIEHLWNSFQVDEQDEGKYSNNDENGNDEDRKSTSLNLKEFAEMYPNINPSLFKEERDNSISNNNNNNTSKILGTLAGTTEDTTGIGGVPVERENYNPIVEEAEEKLQRMFSKVYDSQNDIPLPMQSKIRTLLMDELETVLELWLNVAKTSISNKNTSRSHGDNSSRDVIVNDRENKDEAIFALKRASQLLLQYEAEFIKGLKRSLSDNDESLFIIAAPHTINYQKIISTYYELYNIANTSADGSTKDSDTSQESLVEVQSQCSKLLKKMMKHILSQRMDALENTSNEDDNEIHPKKRGDIPISSSYTQLISMYTSPIHSTSSYTDAIENTTIASSLLQEMELYYHDFFTVSLPLSPETSSSSLSNEHQQFLLSINPSRSTFHNVILSYARIAIIFKCHACANKSLEILNRTNKRYEAYKRECDSDDNSLSKDTTTVIQQPNLSSYKAVFGAFAGLESISIEDLVVIDGLFQTMQQYDDLHADTNIHDILNQCWKKCDHGDKKIRAKGIYEIVVGGDA